MIAVQIDTALLAIPNYASSEEEAEVVFERVWYWAKAIGGGFGIRFLKASDTEDVLKEHGFYPHEQALSELLEVVGLTGVYSPKDLMSKYYSLLSKLVPTCQNLGFEVIGSGEWKADQPVLDNLHPKDLIEGTARALVTGAVVDSELPKWLVATGSSCPALGTARVGFKSNGVQFMGDLPDQLDGKSDFVGSATLLHELECFARVASTPAVREFSETSAEVHLAIALECLRIAKQGGVQFGLDDLPTFWIGTEFVRTMNVNQCGPGGRFGRLLIETCARQILGKPKSPLKEFGGIRAADKAVGYRTHITGGHQALRLMSWGRSDGFEFANVGPKFELHIEPGLLDGAFGRSKKD